ncbi:MAG TPA: hypothetical protein VGM90_41050 [Kofleriaceae bacterium]|jgi:hypothetical protein
MKLFVVLVVALAACGGGSGAGADGDGGVGSGASCSGCLIDDFCAAGTQNMACGRGGEACNVCSGTDSCQDGKCRAPAACNPITCPSGCCDDTDHCKTGTDATACGGDGAACADCGTGSCTAGECVLGCDATTCVGCCNAQGQCVTATSATVCGKNGDACMPCGSGQGCTGGECAGTSCLSTCSGCCTGTTCNQTSQFDSNSCGNAGDVCKKCGPATICTNGDCTVDQLTRWDMIIVSGQVATTKPDGSAWDAFGGLPDPYLCINQQVEPEICISSVSNTLSPVWNATILTDQTPGDIVSRDFWTMYDADVAFSDGMGICINRDNAFAAFDGLVHEFDCTPATAASNGFYTMWKIRYKLVQTR